MLTPPSEIDLGLLAVGGSIEQTLSFTNDGEVECNWSIQSVEAESVKSVNGNQSVASTETASEGDTFKIARCVRA